MIVNFPDLDTLRLALMSGVIPAGIAQKSAVAGFGEQGEVWVESAARLSPTVQKELKRLGAVVCKTSGADLSTEVSCWPELLPLVADDAPASTLEQTPVLFEVPSGEEMARLVLEMLRLGNDRQSFRWLEDGGDSNGAALLRVVGPPYYSLLRALDQLGGPGIAPRAFIERAPGVWVELGYTHPLAAAIRSPTGKILLLRAPRQWTLLPEAPFRDVYEIIEFQLPDSTTHWQDSPISTRLTVAPRLRQAGPADGAELWVLRGAAIDELNRFVQNAEDTLLARLAFAVGEKDGQTIVVLRVRPSKQPPPVVMLPAEAYRGYLKLSNLFLPAGHILHPPLRRDVVRKLLAEDTTQITWLRAGEGGQFTPESLPEDVFRPLTEWVDYVLDRDKELLQAWIQASQFEFEPFVCNEDEPPRPRKPPAEKGRGSRPQPQAKAKDGAGERTEFASSGQQAEVAEEETPLEAFAAVEKAEPSEIQKELEAVEQKFLTLPGTLEDAAHQALWPRLAELNARLDKTEDAGICWLNALWEPSTASHGAAARWTAAWFRTEALGTARRAADSWVARLAAAEGVNREITGEELDALLDSSEPATADLRALAAYLVWSAQCSRPPAPLTQRLQQVQRFLETHERLLPVRACWLAWYHLAHMLGHDVLALARARDRLLERLFHNGLRPEQDLPSFLRFAGQASSARGRGVGPWLEELSERVGPWLKRQKVDLAAGKNPATAAYADLVFAFGLARLGEHDAARQLLRRGQEALRRESKMAHDYLVLAFGVRIEQALKGQPPVGPLFSTEEMDRLDEVEKKRSEDQKKSGRSDGDLGPRLIIDGMRNISRILEPYQRVEPYRARYVFHEEHEKVLAQLPDVMDKKVLAEKLYDLLRNAPAGEKGHGVRAKILQVALDQSFRLHEQFAGEMLDAALKAYDAALASEVSPDALVRQASLLQKGLFVAGHFGRTEHVHAFVSRFQAMLRSHFRTLIESKVDSLTIDTMDALAGHCLYGLRKLGLRAESERLLEQMTASILGGQSLEEVAADSANWSLVRALLPIAGGRYYLGQDDQAEPFFQAARVLLFENKLGPRLQTRLACAYATALGQAPVPVAQARLAELFERLEGVYDSYLTSKHFSQFQFRVIETAVLAVVSDDFTQGARARRWLDDDEFLVRRRIHDDYRKLMAQA